MGLRTTFFAMTYDWQTAKFEQGQMGALRERLLADATGRMIEIGAGTGHNLAYYPVDLESVTITEPEPAMLKRLERRVAEQTRDIVVLRAPAEDLPFEAGMFDTVVSTLVLCGVSDQARSLREARRVLRPGGQLLFIEHVRSDNAKLARHQDRMNPVNRFVVHCECNRPTLDSIRAAGFDVTHVEQIAMPKVPSFARPFIFGRATSGGAPAEPGERASTTLSG